MSFWLAREMAAEVAFVQYLYVVSSIAIVYTAHAGGRGRAKPLRR